MLFPKHVFLLKRSELNLVKDLAYQIWPISYASIISKEQINYMLDRSYCTAKLEEDYDNKQQFYGYFDHTNLLGFIHIENNFSQAGQMKIHKLYVDTAATKKGIGKALVDSAIVVAAENKINNIVLNVNRNNPAVTFYKKIKFEIEKEEVINIGLGFVMDDFIMKYTLPC